MQRHRATTLNHIGHVFKHATHPARTYSLANLSLADIPAMTALQVRTGADNVIPRDAVYYRDHFSRGHTALGLLDQNGTLVAHALIRTTAENTTMLNVLVDPQHRGQGLHTQMITNWLDAATKAGTKTASARVRVDNTASLRNFDAAGMTISATEPSPEAPHEITYMMMKTLQPKPLAQLKRYIA